MDDDFEYMPSDETTAAGEAINFDAIEEQKRQMLIAGNFNPYAPPEEQGMDLESKVFGPPQYGSPDPTTSASRLATLEDGHPLDPGLLPEGHSAAISDDYGAEVVDVEEGEGDEEGDEGEEVNATDGAVALAEENNVNLSDVEGTGVDGRIVKSDVEDFIAKRDQS